MNENPKVTDVKRHAGVAGQFSVTATVTYPDEGSERIEFVGSTYGGPVLMRTPAGHDLFVSDPGRHGEFGAEWVTRFFAER